MSPARYRLTGRLEAGELAELYRGLKDERERVEIKLFHTKTSDVAYVKALMEATRALSAVKEPGILHEIDYGLVNKRLAVVRQAVDGYTIGTALQRLGTKEVILPPSIALHIIIQLAEALTRAHTAGVVHGAITPGNLLIGRDGAVGICDFGANKALQAVPGLKAFLSKGRGAYRALEVVQGEEPTFASDLYSLGAIAYELLTLREVAAGKGAGMSTRREAVLPPSRIDRRINARLDPIVMRAIEAAPQRRYKSCAEFSGALRNAMATEGGMPTAADVKRFVSELYPNEVNMGLGPVPFAEGFSLKDVGAGAAEVQAVPEKSVPIPARSSFSNAPAVADPAEPGPETMEALPAFQEYPGEPGPQFDDGTDPGRAGPLEQGWVAPPGTAPVKKALASAATVQDRSTNPLKGRVRVMEDFAGGPLPVDPTATVESPREELLRERPAPVPSSASDDYAAIGLSSPRVPRPLNTQERQISNVKARRRWMTVMAALLAAVGVMAFVVSVQAKRKRPAPVAAEAPAPVFPRSDLTVKPYVDPSVPQRLSAVQPPEPVVPAPSSDPAPVRLDPTPESSPASRRGGAFLTISANIPAWVSVDGTRRGKTPIKKLSVPPGERRIVLEAVATGELKDFKLLIQKGQTRKVEQRFTPPPHR